MSRSILPFDPLTVPVQGTALIEASAGTGKTYGIAALFARLILLEKLPVDKVLVVTFTKAATAELKTRLRGRLDEAFRRIRGDKMDEEADDFMRGLIEQAARQETPERLELRLKAALSQFDNAAIYTIHGFCQRLLGDYAFLCQVPFETSSADDNDKRDLNTYAQDFWRQNVSHDAQNARLAFHADLTPDQVLQQFSRYLGRPDLLFRRPQTDLAAETERAQAVWTELQQRFPELKDLFWRVHPMLNGNKFRKTTYETKLAELEKLLQQTAMPAKWLETNLGNTNGESVFSADYLTAAVKKGHTAPEADLAALSFLHKVRTAASALLDAEQQALIALQLDCLQYVRRTAAEQRATRQERSPDDLLLDVYHALTAGAHRDKLAEAVSQNWRVALIDEFQDTDPLQYEIFRRTFAAHGNPLFLVGDPKQAIYGFRGADIYAYLQAAADTPVHYTLAHNYRSHSLLIDNIGRLFQQKERPFVLEHIGYPAVTAPRGTSRLTPPQAALKIRWLNDGGEPEPNKETLRSRAAEYCADEIAALINQAAEGRLNYKNTPVEAGQIAVLVHSHNQGAMIKRALAARGIPSVSIERESIFAGEEAKALAALLGFWLDPRRTEPLRFILAGTLFGQTAEQLHALNRDEALLSGYISAAEDFLQIWQRQGIYAALTAFARRYGLEGRLLAADGGRTLTNFWQLAELLADENENSHTPAALHQWLLAKIQDPPQNENAVLRLESDEALVKIVTIHASKGLQYPFVFCPFSWDTAEKKNEAWHILHRENGSELLADSQLDEADREQLDDEDLGERLRLLYVALTRAEEQLVIYAARCSSTPRNTFAYLLEGLPSDGRLKTRQAYEAEKENQAEMLRRNWLRWINATPEGIEWQEGAPLSAAVQTRRRSGTEYRAAVYPPRRFSFIRHTSFTGLTRHLGHGPARPDDDDGLQPALDPAELSAGSLLPLSDTDNAPRDIFHFPRGAAAGICLHEILEKHDFARPAGQQRENIAAILEKHGIESEWLDAVCLMADQTAAAPLHGGTTLSSLPAARRKAEMGFVMHFDRLELGRLKNHLAAAGLPEACTAAAERLDFPTLQGFLNGFIDLTCLLPDGTACIIDYKSNHLGMDTGSYTQSALDQAVADHHYYLQAWIYALAAARHLKQRGQMPHTVRIRYLFLRGLDSGSRNGIWSWDIPTASLAEWL